jgi:hypothetical protein
MNEQEVAMRPVPVAVVLAFAALAFPVAAANAGPEGSTNATMCVANTQLRAQNEVPPTTSIASGQTQIKVRNDGTIEFKTHLSNPGQETFIAGHIHAAPLGVNGAIIQAIFVGGPTSDREISQKGEVSNAALGQAICANPDAFYVNYHSTEHPGGAIRGQLG